MSSEEQQQHHHHHHHHRHHHDGKSDDTIKTDEGAVETKDRGLFDFMGKNKEEKNQEEAVVTEFEQVYVSEPEPKIQQHKEEQVYVSEPEPKIEQYKEEEEEKKHSPLEKLRRSDSSSSSSGDEEEEKRGEKKKKKGLKEKISGEKQEEKVGKHHEDTYIPVEKRDEVVYAEPTPEPEEKKGFLGKIKDKLPGQSKKTEEVPPPPPAECAATEVHGHEGEPKEKKGIFEKIKEKLPGYHHKTEEEKEKGKESATY